MFKNEEKIITLLSALSVGIVIVNVMDIGIYSYIYLVAIPLYLAVVRYINTLSESRERIENAVSFCLDETDFNVIDKIEQLRLYFQDTEDVIGYLTTVDSKVLAYAFDERNIVLNYKEFIDGAVRCLSALKGFTGSYYLNLDSHILPQSERVATLLSTLYLVSKQIERGSQYIYITSKQYGGKVSIDVTDQHHNSLKEDLFCNKLFNILSSDEFVLLNSPL